MKYKNIREEELKNKVGADWFKAFDTTEILGNIDFTVFPKQDSLFGRTPLLWAEAKTGNFDVPTMFVQLILTIGKARTFDKTLPPAFLGAFDFKKIAFVDYINIQDIFYLNDFNWNVTPSNHETKEFQLIKERIESVLKTKTYIFDYQKDDKLLNTFIKNNVAKATTKSKIKIDKNNFIPIYLRWVEIVKPIIDVNWDDLKKANIFDSDFYLADIFVDDKDTQTIDDDFTIRDSLFVVFQNQGYKIAKENIKQMFDATINIRNKDAYLQFWKLYKRPPIAAFQDYIIERRDLLSPQDIRERKGAFFTPRIWVELSQKYLTDYLGENWQDEYYIWDCAAGTGNLLAGLTNKYNIYASTLDQADINVMHERVDHGANLLKNHVFQFDFLNDDFFPHTNGSQFPLSEGARGSKLPQSLQDIINDPEKRKKLIIYINPPYAEATTAKTVTGTGENKAGVTTNFKINDYFKPKISSATNEIFALFMAIIYEKIPGCTLGQFSKLKFVNGSNFKKFKEFFKAEYVSGFIVPAETFDNVKGKFPIGFTIWNTSVKSKIDTISTDVYDKKETYLGVKNFYGNLPQNINRWIKSFDDKVNDLIGLIVSTAPDFQHDNQLCILSKKQERYCFNITHSNLIKTSIYFSVRNCIEGKWLNDRDQYTYPKDGWQTDIEFQNDCLAFTLFHSQNKITSEESTNHWIPFTEQEVNAKEKFASNFMTDFIKGKMTPPNPLKEGEHRGGHITDVEQQDLFGTTNSPSLRGVGGVSSENGLSDVKITKEYLQSQNINTENLIFSDQFLPYNPKLKGNSKKLRKAGVFSEVLLWKVLRANGLNGYSFYRQKPILNYIADFYCKELNLVIEIDGNSHESDEAQKYDTERDRQMQVLGLNILRIKDEMVKKNMDYVIKEILENIPPNSFVKEKNSPSPLNEGTPPNPLKEGTPPNPLKEGELMRNGYPLQFSEEATAVFDAGRELWRYYHSQPFPSYGGVAESRGDYNVNASFYDIRAYFQGRNEKGRMNSKSDDKTYMELIGELRNQLNFLADKIKPKIYEYGFLKE